MVDLYLKAMLEKFAPSKKNKFDEAIEQKIQAYVDSLTMEAEPSNVLLINAKEKRAKLIAELKEDVATPELDTFLDDAFPLIKNSGLRYLDRLKYEALILELDRAFSILGRLDPSQEIPVILRHLLKISDESIDALYEIAKGEFQEERIHDCLAILVLLTILDQTNADYWFRMGIAAQRSGNIDLALRAYAASLSIDPALIGAHLFSAECHLLQGHLESAKNGIAAAKNITATDEVDPVWLDLLGALEVQDKSLN